MNRTFASLFCGAVSAVVAATATAGDGPWSVEAGAARVAVDGVRPYAVPAGKLTQNDRRELGAGYLRVARDLGAMWNVGATYTRYGQLRASGESWNSDIFDLGGVNFPAVVPLTMTERIRELSLDGRWRLSITPRWSVAAGPVVSWFRSSAELAGGFPVSQKIATYTANDVRLGAMVEMRFALSPRWACPSRLSLCVTSGPKPAPCVLGCLAWLLNAGEPTGAASR